MSIDQGSAAHDAELEALLAYREAEELEPAGGLGESAPRPMFAFAAPPPAKGISARATELIIEFETGGRACYERQFGSRPVWPKASSGITIGCG